MITQEIKDAWIADLRANPDKQGRKALKSVSGYCCLGRLALVIRDQFPDEFPDIKIEEAGFSILAGGFLTHYLPHVILSKNVQHYCVIMNDVKKLSFDQIADWLESTDLSEDFL